MSLRLLFRSVLISAILVRVAIAQHASVGFIGGTNITHDIQAGQQSEDGGPLPSGGTQTFIYSYDAGSHRPILGLEVNFDISSSWSVEADALHRNVEQSQTVFYSPPVQFLSGPPKASNGPFIYSLSEWEFPILAKYRLPVAKRQLFLEAGPSFRPTSLGSSLPATGITFGGGVELHTAGGFRISPAVRYTHWIGSSGEIGDARPNQFEVLVGIDRPSKARVAAFGVPFSVGVIAGIGAGDDFVVGTAPNAFGANPESNSGIFGLVFESPLPKNWSAEVDGLYRPLHGNDYGPFAHLTWEFPALAKYHLPGTTRIRPIVEGGPTFRTEGNTNLGSVSPIGGVVGAGIEVKWRWLKITPTVRYNRWFGAIDPRYSHPSPNELQLLVSFSN